VQGFRFRIKALRLEIKGFGLRVGGLRFKV